MKKVAVVVRQPHRQYESLRTSLGCLLEDHLVSYVVLDQAVTIDEAFQDNLGFLDEMEGRRYSNHPANVEKYGFTPVSLADIGELLGEQDIVIPF
jgi:hypothetical protein